MPYAVWLYVAHSCVRVTHVGTNTEHLALHALMLAYVTHLTTFRWVSTTQTERKAAQR